MAFLFLFLFFAARGPLTVVASPVAEHRLRTCRLSGHGSRAQPLRGMWDLPRPEHEPVSPASAGGFSTTVPPRKPGKHLLIQSFLSPHQAKVSISELKILELVFCSVSIVLVRMKYTCMYEVQNKLGNLNRSSCDLKRSFICI